MVKQAGSIFSTQYTGTPSTASAGTPKPVAATAAPGVSVVPAAEDHVHAMTTEIIAITSLSDVTISAPASLQVLRWNGSAWVNATENLDDLGDVIITTPASNQVLQYNGTNWVNAGAWASYTPTVKLGATTVTIQNDSKWVQIGKTVVANIAFRFTNLNGGTGNLTVTVPTARRTISNPANSYTNTPGTFNLIDLSTVSFYGGIVRFNTDSDLAFYRFNAAADTIVTHNSPITIVAGASATGDEFYATVTYEAA